jgi:acyl transferase domain-containing protein
MGTRLSDTLSKDGILSPDKSCKSFDASANGYARAEGINAVFIKRYKDAIRDGNSIRAVIRNTGLNCDGNSQSLTTPSCQAHDDLMRMVYSGCELDPGETAFVEVCIIYFPFLSRTWKTY